MDIELEIVAYLFAGTILDYLLLVTLRHARR